MTIKWEGLDELEAGLTSVAKGTKSVVESALMFPAATVGEKLMKKNAAVDTGQMVNLTRTTQVSATDIEWRSDAPYAGYQDFGTARQPGKPFFRSSILSIQRLIQRRAPIQLQHSIARVLSEGGVWKPRNLLRVTEESLGSPGSNVIS